MKSVQLFAAQQFLHGSSENPAIIWYLVFIICFQY